MKRIATISAVISLVVYTFSFFAPQPVRAAESQRCKTGESCIVGEYLYDDSYSPITDATCTLKSRNPDGTIYLNNVAMTSAAENDGWYSYSFDTTGKSDGIYRTQMCCTSSGDLMCLDKTFSIGASYLSTTDVSSAVWDDQTSSHSADGTFGKNLQVAAPTTADIWSYSGRTLTSFGTLIADMWSYSSRSLTNFGTLVADIWSSATRTLSSGTLSDGGSIATSGDIQTATNSAVTSIKGASNKDLTQVSTQVAGVQTTSDTINTKTDTLTTNVAAVQTTANSINTKVDTLTTNLATMQTSVNTLVTKWGSYSASDIITQVSSTQTDLGTTSDTCSDATVFGYVQCLKDKWGAQTATSIYTQANNAATSAAALRTELNYNGKSSTAYDDIQTLLTNLTAASSAITSANTAISSVNTAVAGVQTKVNTIDTKVDSLTTQVSSLSTSVGTMNTNVNTLVTKWSTYNMADVITGITSLQTDLGSSSNSCSDDTVFGYVQCLRDKWGSQTADALYTQANTAATSITSLRAELDYNGKSTTAYEDMQSIQTTVAAMQDLIGATADTSSTATLFGRIKKVQETTEALDTSGAGLSDLLDKWGDYSANDIYDKVKNLSSDISAVNTVSNVSSILTLSNEAKVDLTSLKNSILSLQALTEVNKSLLQNGTSKPIVKTWLEEGSIIFKSLVTNPTELTQVIPFKLYLPKEASKKDIEKIDDVLTVGYDPSNDATYVAGEFKLRPHETKITYVELQDIWVISAREIASLRLQNKELFEPLKNTALFAQGATLNSDVTAALDNIERIQAAAHTPEDRIQAYREAMIDYNRAKSDIDSLKALLASSGSTQTLVGFVGGIQTLSVWGLIVILISGFVFLALYMRFITDQTRHIKKASGFTIKQFLKGGLPRKILTRSMMIFIAVCVLSMFTVFMLRKPIEKMFDFTRPVVSPVPDSHFGGSAPLPSPREGKNDTKEEVTIQDEKQVLGASTSENKVTIVVDSQGINVREGPSTDTKVVRTILKTSDAEKLNQVENWVQISLSGDASTPSVKGWVNNDFVKSK